jgi:MFS family permease
LNNKLDEFRSDGSEIGQTDSRKKGLTGYFSKTFASFQVPSYRFYFASMAGHWSSMSMLSVARSQLAYDITQSGAVLGLVSLANAIPHIILLIPGGFIADRVQKKTVVQIAQVGSAVFSLAVTIAILMGYLSPAHPESWWVLVACAALQGADMGLQLPSRQAILSELVSEKYLMNAISLNNLGMNVFRIFMPALAGFIVDAFGPGIAYATMTALYAVAAICMIFVPKTSTPRKSRGQSSMAEVAEAWRYIRGEKAIFATVLGMPYAQLLPMFTSGIFDQGATGMGFLITISGFGAIIGSFILTSMSNRRRATTMLVFGLVMSAALLGFAFSGWWYVSLLLMLFVGLGNTGQMALGNSLVQYYCKPEYRGRVLSFYFMAFGFGGLGTYFAGVFADRIGTQGTIGGIIGVQWAVGGMAAILLVITIMMLMMSPKLRKLD